MNAPPTVAFIDLIASLGTDSFSRELHRYLQSGIQATVLFAFAIRTDGGQAAMLMSEAIDAKDEEHRATSRNYAASDFRNDPLFTSLRTSGGQLPFVKVRRASEMEDPVFRERYFGHFGTEEELSIVGDSRGTELLYVGFCANHFSDAETHFASEQAALVLALLRKDGQLKALLRPTEVPVLARSELLHRALIAHPSHLTEREAEVCAEVMKGYSSDAIAMRLGISSHTVATHRKRAYAKLKISSQVELFANIYSVANSAQNVAPTEPQRKRRAP
jgi:DNA-binding CsgD family transcriptional regulator